MSGASKQRCERPSALRVKFNGYSTQCGPKQYPCQSSPTLVVRIWTAIQNHAEIGQNYFTYPPALEHINKQARKRSSSRAKRSKQAIRRQDILILIGAQCHVREERDFEKLGFCTLSTKFANLRFFWVIYDCFSVSE